MQGGCSGVLLSYGNGNNKSKVMLELIRTVLSFLLALGILVTIHEYGHFWMARFFGMRVLRFSIGFGNPLFKWRDRHGTDYWIATIPLGGYVKLLDSREGPVPEAMKTEEFSHRPVQQRLAVYFAGPAINLIFAFLLYWMLFATGVSVLIPRVGDVPVNSPAAMAGFERGHEILSVDGKYTVSWEDVSFALVDRLGDSGQILFEVKTPENAEIKKIQVSIDRFLSDAPRDTSPLDQLGLAVYVPKLPAQIGEVLSDTPAERAGFQAGDRVLTVAGQAITDWSNWVKVIRENPEKPLAVEVQRQDTVVALTVTPEAQEGPSGAVFGRIGAGALQTGQDDQVRQVRFNPLASAAQALHKTWDRITMTLATLGKMVVGRVSVENLSGPITIAQVAADTAQFGFEPFVNFLAYLSISLGILNLLPIPVLDGGHILFGLYEWLRGQPLSDKVQQAGLGFGLSVLAVFMAVAFYNDLMRITQ